MKKQPKPKVEVETCTEKEILFNVPRLKPYSKFNDEESDLGEWDYEDYYMITTSVDHNGGIIMNDINYDCDYPLTVQECEGLAKYFQKVADESKKRQGKK